MSVLTGGIFSRPRGKTAGLVFGSARTRTGKLVTARELVPPSNPNTAAQQIQRGKFAEALAIVRLLGATIYQEDWNRAIGQLPGFQSLDSVYLNAIDADLEVGVVPPINLGSLHVPDTVAAAAGGGSGEVAVTWSDEHGLNGTDSDDAIVIGVSVLPAASPLERYVQIQTGENRDAMGVDLSGFAAGASVAVLVYFRGAGTAEGLLTPTKSAIATAGA